MNDNEEIFRRAVRVMPGGVNSPVRSFRAVGGTPRFAVRAEGSRFTDAEGREYIDYVMSWGPNILGHARREVVEAVKAAAENGLTFGVATEREVALAETIRSLVPSMEVVRMVNSGTEATMSAVRLARAFTRRDLIVSFNGCYHGHADTLIDTRGVPAALSRLALKADYNDADAVAALFRAHPGRIAAVIVEPVAANMGVVPPAPGFLAALRELTAADGALLIFDEVITGFRLAPGGAQAYYGVAPDLTTLGKIVGGGLPAGAFGGREEIMRMIAPDGPVYQAGTLSGNPLTTAAGLATLEILRSDPGIYARLEAKARRIEDALSDIVETRRAGSLLGVKFKREGDYARWFHRLLDAGVYVAPAPTEALFVSDAHTDADIAQTCKDMANAARW